MFHLFLPVSAADSFSFKRRTEDPIVMKMTYGKKTANTLNMEECAALCSKRKTCQTMLYNKDKRQCEVYGILADTGEILHDQNTPVFDLDIGKGRMKLLFDKLLFS